MLYCHQVAIKSMNAALNIHGFLLCFLSVIRGRFNPQMSEKEAAAFIIKVIQSCFLSSRWDKSGDTLTRCKHDNLLCYVVVVYVQGSHAHIYINLSSTGAKRTTCCSITRTKSLTEDPPCRTTTVRPTQASLHKQCKLSSGWFQRGGGCWTALILWERQQQHGTLILYIWVFKLVLYVTWA